MSTGIEVELIKEENVIDILLGFDEFKRFYHGEYELRKKSVGIEWGIATKLPGSWAESAVNNETGANTILLRNPPIGPPAGYVEALLVAHEIEHVIRRVERMSLAIAVNDLEDGCEDMAKNLRSMFEDPIVDSILQDKYGFDLVYFYAEMDIQRCKYILRLPYCKEPDKKTDRLTEIFFYACQSLKWDLIKDAKIQQKYNDYKKLYMSKRPNIAKEGEELASLVRTVGFDTLEKQKRLFELIVDKYKLGDILYVE